MRAARVDEHTAIGTRSVDAHSWAMNSHKPIVPYSEQSPPFSLFCLPYPPRPIPIPSSVRSRRLKKGVGIEVVHFLDDGLWRNSHFD
jgi:hypothetical protein